MVQELNDILAVIDSYIGGGAWFIWFLLGTGLFFTLYLRFPQVRYFGHALRVVRGKYDKKDDVGDTSHFQALATALSGTVGVGNIAGVALAIHLGGPAALFWMMITAFLGMTTKFVEVTLSHKYREKDDKGNIAGGPMYYMKKRLGLKWIAIIFAIATVISSFGTGNLPQANGIANAVFATFGVSAWITGGLLALLLGFVIVGGISRIAQVSEKLVPAMAIIYFLGAIAVIITNYQNIIPSFLTIAADLFSGTAATGGFLGASVSFAINRGVARGLFSNEAGQGSAPIAHAAARAHEPVSEGIVALLEPFIDTIIICMLTGLVVLSSGVWREKHPNQFQQTDTEILAGTFSDTNEPDKQQLYLHIAGEKKLPVYSGTLTVENGKIQEANTILHARSVAEEVVISKDDKPYSGPITVNNGKIQDDVVLNGLSLVHSAQLTTVAFTKSFLKGWGKYIVAIGLLLFAFSTAISWSYYGDRAMTFLFNSTRPLMIYRIIYVIGFFVGSVADTTIIWTFSGIAIALMTLPNLCGILILHKEVKETIAQYWEDFKAEHPHEKIPKGR